MEGAALAGVSVLVILAIVGLVLVAFIVLQAIFFAIAAALAGLPNRSFGRAFLVALIGLVVPSVAGSIGSVLPVFGNLAGLVLGCLAMAWIVQRLYEPAGYLRSLVAYLLSAVVAVAASLAVAVALLLLLAPDLWQDLQQQIG